jgi:multidrug efflux pump subunit AcrA (membrane-fusion protein)
VVLLLLACAVFLSTAKGVYRLSADARIENAIQRAIVAPYDGYIDDAVVRAGDLVSAGQTLVAMDDKDLRLEKLKWISEQGKLNRQYQEAVAIRDRVKINVINAQLDQVQAQLQLVTSQMDRSKLTSPFDGVVVSGDLSQRLGSSVTKGEALLEVAPANNYRIRLLIKENRIADIHTKQLGRLYLSALPESSFDFELSKITPLTDIKDGTTYFIVEGELLSNSAPLQSGMEGVGKIIIDERRLVDIWTRDMFEWLRLKLWSWWG